MFLTDDLDATEIGSLCVGQANAGFVMVRILIADDHAIVRYGLRKDLEARPGWEVVAEATNGKDAVSKAAATKPDVAILDCMMPLINGIEATRQIRSRAPKTEVLIFTAHDDENLIAELLRAGARGYVLKSGLTDELITAVQSLAEHKPFFTSKAVEMLLASMMTSQIQDTINLTYPERVLVRLVAEGCTNKEMADILDTTQKAVESRRMAIMRKLNLSSPAALVLYAIRNRLIEP
jgi:DNA-binding NarL/FixJ family response regulator